MIRGLQQADMYFNRQVNALQEETEQMALDRDQASADGSEENKYHYASKLLQQGMTVEEVMTTCNLMRSEAVLLQILDGYRQFKKS